MRLRRRIPAVSTNRSGPSGVSTMVSMASRVVPGSSWTTLRSSPTSRLKRVDLPTLGRPTIAIENSFGASGAGSRSGGSAPITASRRSPLPRPWIAETGIGSPSPSPAKDQASVSRRSSSTLLATTRTGLSLRWRSRATWASSSVIPTAQSRTSRSTSASVMARSACALTARVRVLASSVVASGGSHPPVSTMLNGRPCHSASRTLRSRVTPGFSSTMVRRPPTMRFTRVDFPTFGRPMTATIGRVM